VCRKTGNTVELITDEQLNYKIRCLTEECSTWPEEIKKIFFSRAESMISQLASLR